MRNLAPTLLHVEFKSRGFGSGKNSPPTQKLRVAGGLSYSVSEATELLPGVILVAQKNHGGSGTRWQIHIKCPASACRRVVYGNSFSTFCRKIEYERDNFFDGKTTKVGQLTNYSNNFFDIFRFKIKGAPKLYLQSCYCSETSVVDIF